LDWHAAPRTIDFIAFGIDPIVVLVHPIGWNRLTWIVRFLMGHAISEFFRADVRNKASANQFGRLGSHGPICGLAAD
jgi:hypothetical protein